MGMMIETNGHKWTKQDKEEKLWMKFVYHIMTIWRKWLNHAQHHTFCNFSSFIIVIFTSFHDLHHPYISPISMINKIEIEPSLVNIVSYRNEMKHLLRLMVATWTVKKNLFLLMCKMETCNCVSEMWRQRGWSNCVTENYLHFFHWQKLKHIWSKVFLSIPHVYC